MDRTVARAVAFGRAAVVPTLVLALDTCTPRSTGAEGGPAPRASAPVSAAASVFDEMHAAACAGDPDRFFANVAEAVLLDNLAKRMDDAEHGHALAKARLDFWRKEIKQKAKEGAFCAWTFVGTEKIGETQRVEARSKTGDKRTLFFADTDGPRQTPTPGGERLKLIDYQSDDPNLIASLIASAEPVDATLDVAELLKDYKGNELHADAKYKGKRVRIIGKAGEMKRDLANTIYMTVGTGEQFEIPEAQCFFGEEHVNSVASISHGATVVVNCTVAGLMMNVLMKDCSFPSVATLNACYKLQNAGIAKRCSPVKTGTEETSFETATPPPNLPESRVKEWVAHTFGMVVLLRDDSAYIDYTAWLEALPRDAGLWMRTYVGSPDARIVVFLPEAASPDLLPRVKSVVDQLAPSAKGRE